MAELAEDTCSAALGQYKHLGFRLYEQIVNDYPVALILEHTPCGFKDKLPITGIRISAIRNDCEDHLKKCEFYGEKGQ